MGALERIFPGLRWFKDYDRKTFADDALASIITAILLIPQSLAYALLAGLPPQAGLYASTTPLIAYAFFGSSRVLAVGPVAVVSLMTAAAIGNLGLTDPADQMAAAGALALLSAAFLILFGILKLGGVANFLSKPVIGAFITASTILIIASQLRHILGVEAQGATLPEFAVSMLESASTVNMVALGMGAGSLLFLILARTMFKRIFMRMGLGEGLSDTIMRAAPAILVIAATLTAASFEVAALAAMNAHPGQVDLQAEGIIALHHIAVGGAAMSMNDKTMGERVLVEAGPSAASAPCTSSQEIDTTASFVAVSAADSGAPTDLRRSPLTRLT